MPSLQVADCQFNAKGFAGFDAVVLGAEARQYNTGSYGLNFFLEVSEGPAMGKHVYATLWLTPTALQDTLARLESCFGFQGGVDELELAVGHRKFDGEAVRVSVCVEQYDGRDRLRASIWPKNESKPLTKEQWTDLKQRLGSSSKGPVTAPPPATNAPLDTDDELPF